MNFEQSKTYQNLHTALEDKLMASTFYRIYGDAARSEGFIQIGDVFDTTARNEFEHARIFFRRLNNGVIPKTEVNLKTSIDYEASIEEVYRGYAQTATNEGFTDLASLFSGIANIELNHNLRFKSLYDDVISGQVFCKPEAILWICMECGNILSGTCAPDICPICGFPQGYYRVFTQEEMLSR